MGWVGGRVKVGLWRRCGGVGVEWGGGEGGGVGWGWRKGEGRIVEEVGWMGEGCGGGGVDDGRGWRRWGG